jgi:Fic-DOC domain mobile mystery protein B
MFDRTWRWAGCFRTRGTNIGVAPERIAEQLHEAIADAAIWIRAGVYDADGCAARFHHRLVWVHPFPNGNGRWGRLVADLLLQAQGLPPFSWGARRHGDDPRTAYLRALRAADHGDVLPLLAFVRA